MRTFGGQSTCEYFNLRLRNEFLNGEIFYSAKEIRVLSNRWRGHYNTGRQHSSLDYRPPAPETARGKEPGARRSGSH
jgi:putative transposase